MFLKFVEDVNFVDYILTIFSLPNLEVDIDNKEYGNGE